jgi:hypothetical protein
VAVTDADRDRGATGEVVAHGVARDQVGPNRVAALPVDEHLVDLDRPCVLVPHLVLDCPDDHAPTGLCLGDPLEVGRLQAGHFAEAGHLADPD